MEHVLTDKLAYTALFQTILRASCTWAACYEFVVRLYLPVMHKSFTCCLLNAMCANAFSQQMWPISPKIIIYDCRLPLWNWLTGGLAISVLSCPRDTPFVPTEEMVCLTWVEKRLREQLKPLDVRAKYRGGTGRGIRCLAQVAQTAMPIIQVPMAAMPLSLYLDTQGKFTLCGRRVCYTHEHMFRAVSRYAWLALRSSLALG